MHGFLANSDFSLYCSDRSFVTALPFSPNRHKPMYSMLVSQVNTLWFYSTVPFVEG